MNKRKIKKSYFLIIVMIILGTMILLYPTISNWWNEIHASKAVDDYEHAVVSADQNLIWEEREKAAQYNEALYSVSGFHALSDSEMLTYLERLNLDGDGMMGYIEIPKLTINMPIYHGTAEEVLERSVGHVEWSSLPVGGENTHCIIAGHRALPGARLFTDLDTMETGDIFILHVLDEELYYEIESIKTVLPEDVSSLTIEPSRDLCTLVTCTPYGINTHRLLLTGHRIENPDISSGLIKENEPTNDIAPILIIVVLAAAGFFIFLFIRKRRSS